MSKLEVIVDYSKTPDHELDNFAQGVYNSLNPNTNFTWGAGVMTNLLAGITIYKTKLEAKKVDVAEKNIAKSALLTLLRTTATEVNRQANGDLIKLKSSGFKLVKEPSKVGVLPKPTGFKVASGNNSGELKFTVDAHVNASMYFFYSAPVPAPADIHKWRLSASSSHSKCFNGYDPGVKVELKCAYKGAVDELIFSDSIFIYVQ